MGAQVEYRGEEIADFNEDSVEEHETEEMSTDTVQGNPIKRRPWPGLLLPHEIMALCGEWLSVGVKKVRTPALELPWLMLAKYEWWHGMVDELDEDDEYTCSFFAPSDGTVHKLSIPELHRRVLLGSSHGWLVTVKAVQGEQAGRVREDCKVSLLNPLTREEIQLPRQKRYPLPIALHKEELDSWKKTRGGPYFFRKAILSCDPAKEGCMAVAITYFHNLAFCRIGDDRWSVLDGQYDLYEDIIFFKGQLHAVNASGMLSTFEFGPLCPHWKCLDTPYLGFEDWVRKDRKKYLVGCGDQLLLVLRLFRDKDCSETVGFEVFRWEESSPEWVKAKDLGGLTMFLGLSDSEGYPAELFPDKGGFRGNCIYYAEDGGCDPCMDAPGPCEMQDMGVYSMEDGIIEAFFSPDGEDLEEVYPPIWLSPNPWWGALQ